MSATGYLGIQFSVLALQLELTEPRTIESFFFALSGLILAVAGIIQISRKNVF